MKKIVYVLLFVFDPNAQFCVGITKKAGPVYLLNKLTFPGGKIEAGESLAAAAAREMQEETGVDVPEDQWRLQASEDHGDYELHSLIAVSADVYRARQMEAEPVHLFNIERQCQYAQERPELYAPDFLKRLSGAQQFAKNELVSSVQLIA